ncbi:MAG: hypothetical protein QOI74_3378, partial [Micromonosporaceae bacterium]|nr:hypothetical protein [Micromonosporaceae bacterium]
MRDLPAVFSVGGHGREHSGHRARTRGRAVPSSAVTHDRAIAATGVPVAVIGAGIAGLVTAYELEQRGYRVVILEGSRRIGGRIYSHRFGGDADSPVAELGAMRIPAGHTYTMGYIATLGLSDELRPFHSLLADENAYLGTPTGYRRLRDAPAALLAELRRRHSVDAYREETLLFAARLSLIVDAIAPPAQRESLRRDLGARLLDLVERIDLRPYLADRDGGRIDLHGLFVAFPHLRAACGGDLNTFLDDILTETSPDLVRVRGGMARIVERLARRLRAPILLGREVVGLSVKPDGVAIEVRAGGRTVVHHREHVVCTVPLPLLRRMRLRGFTDDKLDVIHKVQYVPATKVAFHCREPFWEHEGISGGASCSGGRIRQTYYPAVDGDRALGAVLLASYTIGDDAEVLGRLPAPQRHAAVLAELAEMHPRLRSPGMVLDAVSVAWGGNRWSGSGCSVRWGKNPTEYEKERSAVARPIGSLYFAGEHCSSAPA